MPRQEPLPCRRHTILRGRKAIIRLERKARTALFSLRAGINSAPAWENDSGPLKRALLPAECELSGYKRKTRGHLLCRPQPGCGERAGRRASCADRSKRYREPIQPHRDCGSNHVTDGKGEAADTYRIGGPKLRLDPGFRGASGTNPDAG